MSYISEPVSYRAQIENLDIGESFARAVRFDGNDPELIGKDHLAEVARSLRLATQPTVYRITKRTGYQYTIECGEFRTDLARDLVIVVVVTRIA